MATACKAIWGPVGGTRWGGDSGLLPDSTSSFNAAGEYCSTIFRAWKTGVIDRVAVQADSVSGTLVLNAQIVTVDASGIPTSTAKGGCSLDTYNPSNAGNTIIFATGATVTRGDLCAVKIGYSSGTGSQSFIYGILNKNAGEASSLPYHYINTGTPTRLSAGAPNIGVRFSTGEWQMACGSPLTSTLQAQLSTEERGALFQVPVTMSCAGFKISVGGAGGYSWTFRLRNAAGTVLASKVVDADALGVGFGTSSGWMALLWDTSVSLSALTDYRITAQHDSGTSKDGPYYITMLDAAMRSGTGYSNGTLWTKTSQISAGGFVDDTLSVPICGILVDSVG